jgi:hypothetical protein
MKASERPCVEAEPVSMQLALTRPRRKEWLALIILAIVFGSCITDRPPKPASNWTVGEAQAFNEFPLYWLGDGYQDMPLLSMRLTEDGDGVTHASFNYGEPSFIPGSFSGGSWKPKLEIDIQPYCGYPPREFLSNDEYWDEDWNAEPVGVTIRGVSDYLQRYSTNNASLFLWTGASTVHLYTWKSELDIEAAASELIQLAPEAGTSAERLEAPIRSSC